MESPEKIRERFLANADIKYRTFSEKVVVPSESHRIAGIRMPVIRKFAKDICGGDWRTYLDSTNDEYHEDLLLRGFIIARAKIPEEDRCAMITDFVPMMDNWGVCDSFASELRVNRRNSARIWDMILPFLDSDREFEARFAIAMMLFHFMDDVHADDIIAYMDAVRNDAYYVRMAVAWCLSVCFVKFPERTTAYLKNSTLDKFTFNKTLSKITDSLRVSGDVKDEIRKMRRK
ncbi:MAG: DNA alkylation repair protein [Methanomassiliicoccaceae archaeon]|nr:DNA alkylation repair protein [Methanomassiliicoccaceae archaeon]